MSLVSSPRELRRAAILAVGSELLTAGRLDTNSLFITDSLNAIGIEVVFKGVVGDDRDELAAQFRQALARVDVMVLTGGLGPTADDLTREVVAEVLSRSLAEDEAITAAIRQRFALRGWKMPEINRRQAMVPQGAVVLANPNGTAPGLWLEEQEKCILLVPGPPREMKPMIEQVVTDRLRPLTGANRVARRVLKIAGRSESRVEELTQPLYGRWLEREPPVATTILTIPGLIELHLSARGHDETQLKHALEEASAELSTVLSNDVVSTDGRALEAVVGELLVQRRWKLSFGESCTGGLAASRVTDVPGASAYFDRSVVVYSNEAKTDLLGVKPALIAAHGAVSEEVALAMAHGLRARSQAHVSVAITGIAGPSGATAHKPVGLVCIAVITPDAEVVRTFRFPGNRELVKTFSVVTALDTVRRMLLGHALVADWGHSHEGSKTMGHEDAETRRS